MLKKVQVAQTETTHVFISDVLLPALKAQSVIKMGYRQATLLDIVLEYRHNANFRQELHAKGPVWIAEEGNSRKDGFYEILQDGTLSKISAEVYYNELPPAMRAHYHSVPGFMAVDCSYGKVMELSVNSGFWLLDVAPVAYVKDGRVASEHWFVRKLSRLRRM